MVPDVTLAESVPSQSLFSPRRALLATLAAALVACGVCTVPARATVPGHPGEPQPPTTVYSEDFEHGPGTKPVLLTAYTGAPPQSQKYTAAAPFLKNCNGNIVEFKSGERTTATDCEKVAFDSVRQMAWALGELRNATHPEVNHAVTAYTDGLGTLKENTVQFETATPLPIPQNGRFITFSVDAAEANCFASHAKFKFYLLNGAAETPTFLSPIDPCSDPSATRIKVPAVGEASTKEYLAGTYAGDAATLFTGTQLGIRMRNGQTSESGNDAAFDNIEVLDATPQLDKSFSPSVLNVGEVSHLTFTITNTSELGAKSGWAFTDALPAGLVVAAPAVVSTTCAKPTTVAAPAGGGSIAVTAGSLPVGQASCTLTVDVTSAAAGEYTNGPTDITSRTGINPPGPATVTFGNNADLQIEKSADPVPASPDSDETFTLKVTNKGPNVAEDVVVSDPLPAGLSLVSASSGCDAVGSPPELKCELGSLTPDQSLTLTFVAHIADSVSDGFVNAATVSSITPDPDLSNNLATADVPIPPEADLEIRKTASVERVTAGGQVSYVLLVSNNGPHDATDVTVADPLSPLLLAIAADPSQGTCSTSDGVLCRLGPIAAGASAQILVSASVAASAGGSLSNTASVTGGQTDPDPTNNSSSATIDVVPLTPNQLGPGPAQLAVSPFSAESASDMQIVKRVDHARALVGQVVTYTLHVANLGPDDAGNVRVTDTWRTRLRVVSAHPSQGTCQVGSSISCGLGGVRSGARATITIHVKVVRVGKQLNTARVTSSSAEANLANNQSSVVTRVSRRSPAPKPPPRVTG